MFFGGVFFFERCFLEELGKMDMTSGTHKTESSMIAWFHNCLDKFESFFILAMLADATKLNYWFSQESGSGDFDKNKYCLLAQKLGFKASLNLLSRIVYIIFLNTSIFFCAFVIRPYDHINKKLCSCALPTTYCL